MQSRAHSAGFLAACTVAVAVYSFLAIRSYMAARYAQVLQRASNARAVALEPGNSEYQSSMGAVLLYAEQDPRGALPYFEKAIALNPYRSRYWLEAGTAWAILGDPVRQKTAIEGALRHEPTNPAIVWEAANLMIVTGDTPRALELFRRYAEIDPGYATRAFDVCWRALHDVDVMLATVVPATVDTRLQLVQYLVKREALEAAGKAWESALSLHQGLDGQRSLGYVDALLEKHMATQAAAAWDAIVKNDSAFAPYAAPGNLITNSRFESPILNHGFDWRLRVNPAVTVAVDNSEFHAGGRSLSFEFSGDPVGDTGVFQYIAVEPRTSYQFSAFIKAAEVYSANGPQFQVEDTYAGNRLMTTEPVLGSSGWKEQRGEFTTGDNTRLVTIRIAQPQSSHIKGTLWIGDLRLARN